MYLKESYVGDVQCLENVIFDVPIIVSVANDGRYDLLIHFQLHKRSLDMMCW